MKKTLKPTFYLRWFFASKLEEEGACGVNVRGYSSSAWVMRQWWADDSGAGEWRNIVEGDGSPPL